MKAVKDGAYEVEQSFVVFLSPGTFVAEESRRPVETWDVDAAKKAAATVTERHGAKPYGFYFITRGRKAGELDSKQTKRSGMYYLGGTVRTAEEVLAGEDPGEQVLRENVRANGFEGIVTSEQWGWTQPLLKGDVVLEM